jgi:hypothetical protein
MSPKEATDRPYTKNGNNAHIEKSPFDPEPFERGYYDGNNEPNFITYHQKS